MKTVWTLYGLVSINAWICSTIFHSRDIALTEKLDYFSAFSIVVYGLLAFILRILGSWRTLKRHIVHNGQLKGGGKHSGTRLDIKSIMAKVQKKFEKKVRKKVRSNV
jgi:hypothetical protein